MSLFSHTSVSPTWASSTVKTPWERTSMSSLISANWSLNTEATQITKTWHSHRRMRPNPLRLQLCLSSTRWSRAAWGSWGGSAERAACKVQDTNSGRERRRKRAFDEDVLPTATAAQGSKHNRPLQTRRCCGSNAELKGERGTGEYCVGTPLPSPEHRRAISAQQELLFY